MPAANIESTAAKSGAFAANGVLANGGTRGFALFGTERPRAAIFADPSLGIGHRAGSIADFGGAGGDPIVTFCEQGISISA